VSNLIHSCLGDPLTTLSCIQAQNYLAASIVVRYGHDALWRCYLISALIYTGFAVAHQLPH
jgi:hypothetical protein